MLLSRTLFQNSIPVLPKKNRRASSTRPALFRALSLAQNAHRRKSIAFTWLLFFTSAASQFYACNKFPADTPPAITRPDFQKGMTLACWSDACMGNSRSEASLSRLKTVGVEWATIVVTGYQSDERAHNIVFNVARSPGDPFVRGMIAQARNENMKITLKPHVDLNNGQWRGHIKPDSLDVWFENYRDFIMHYATMAEELDVEQFIVGVELVSLNRQDQKWRELIAEVRGVFSGKILYSASWNEFERIDFWEALDFAGINAYFPLTDLKNPSQVDLAAGWQFWINRLENWHEKIGKDVIFTEIGYTSRNGTNTRPYDFNMRTSIDVDEQADCYKAALRAVSGIEWIKGVHWWRWDTVIRNARGDYPPLNGPAEDELRKAWSSVGE